MDGHFKVEELIRKSYYSRDYKSFQILCYTYSITKRLADIILYDAISKKDWEVIKFLKVFPIEATNANFNGYTYQEIIYLESIIYDISTNEFWYNLLSHMLKNKYNPEDIRSFIQNDKEILKNYYKWLRYRIEVPYELIELLNILGCEIIPLSTDENFNICIERILYYYNESMLNALKLIIKVYSPSFFNNISIDHKNVILIESLIKMSIKRI